MASINQPQDPPKDVGTMRQKDTDVLANMSRRLATDERKQREEAVFWIEELTGIALPVDTCEAFRAKLRDGVILCNVVNAIAPGTIARVRPPNEALATESDSNRRQPRPSTYGASVENVAQFLSAVRSLGLPQELIFSRADLEYTGSQGRPSIAECITGLRWHLEQMAKDPSIVPCAHFRTPKLKSPKLNGSSPSPYSGESPSTTGGTPAGAASPLPASPLPVTPPGSMVAFAHGLLKTGIWPPADGAGSAGPSGGGGAGDPPGSASSDAGDRRWTGEGSDGDSSLLGGGATAREVAGTSLGDALLKLAAEYDRRLNVKEEELATRDAAVAAKDSELQDLLESVTELQEAAEIGLALAEAQKRRRDVGVGDGAVHEGQEEAARAEAAQRELAARAEALEAQAAELQAAAESQARLLEEERQQQLQQTSLSLRRQSSLQQSLQQSGALQRQVQQLREDLNALRRDFSAGFAAHTGDIQRLSAAMGPLCRLALRSAQLLRENIKLRNSLQDVRGAIRIFCRVRAMLPAEPGEEGAPMVEVPAPLEPGLPCREVIVLGSRPLSVAARIAGAPRAPAPHCFTLDGVWGPTVTQEDCYMEIAPSVRSVCDGHNVAVLAYGQTGSGKTYTMMGPSDRDEAHRGITYRSAEEIFLLARERAGSMSYQVAVQMLEIYNEQVRDLLKDPAQSSLDVRAARTSTYNVPDASTVKVENAEEVAMVIARGEENRAVGFTAMNAESTRSHCCLIIHVERQEAAEFTRGAPTTLATLTLVDLAGSERVGRAETAGDRLKEAQHINKSLSALGDVIAALQNRAPHVPYRNSKLTMLLQPTFASQGKVVMLFNVSPMGSSVPESISTLTFAQRAASVELGWRNSDGSGSDRQAVVQLLEQVTSLEAEVAGRRAETTALRAALADERLNADLLARKIEDLERKLADSKRRNGAAGGVGAGGSGSADGGGVRGGSWPVSGSGSQAAVSRAPRPRQGVASDTSEGGGDIPRSEPEALSRLIGEGSSSGSSRRTSVVGRGAQAIHVKPGRASTATMQRAADRDHGAAGPPHHAASAVRFPASSSSDGKRTVGGMGLYGEASLQYLHGKTRPRSGPMERRPGWPEQVQVQRPANSGSHVRTGAAAGSGGGGGGGGGGGAAGAGAADSLQRDSSDYSGKGSAGRESAIALGRGSSSPPPSSRPSCDDTADDASCGGASGPHPRVGSSRSDGGGAPSFTGSAATFAAPAPPPASHPPPLGASAFHDGELVEGTRREQLLRTSNTPLERRVAARRASTDVGHRATALSFADGDQLERKWDASAGEDLSTIVRPSKTFAEVGRALVTAVATATKEIPSAAAKRREERVRSQSATRRKGAEERARSHSVTRTGRRPTVPATPVVS